MTTQYCSKIKFNETQMETNIFYRVRGRGKKSIHVSNYH